MSRYMRTIVFLVLVVGLGISILSWPAIGQVTDAASHRDPAKVIDDALTRIFDGGGETPTGDTLSLQLSAAEHASANHAGRMFNTLDYSPGYGYPESAIYDPAFRENAQRYRDRLRDVLGRYRSTEQLSASETAEITGALSPFLRYLSVVAETSRGRITVPPRTKCRIKLSSYCMDKDWPAPRTGEKMQLVPIETLLPGNLAVFYRSLLRQAANDTPARAQMQGLVWTLRQIAQDPKGQKAVTLSRRQRNILESAHQNGYAYFQMLRQPLGRSSLPEELEKLVREEVAKAIGTPSATGEFITKELPDRRMEEAVNQQARPHPVYAREHVYTKRQQPLHQDRQ